MTQYDMKSTTSADVDPLKTVLDETGLFPASLLPEMIAPFLSTQTEAFWLTAFCQGEAVGLCYTAPEELAEGAWTMLALAVRPGVQGRGIGAALVAEAERRLQERGARLVIVETSGTPEFAQARGFYERCGYEEEARIRDFWAAGDDKVIFRKAL